MQKKTFVWDKKMQHRIELMVIVLVVTVILNIVFWQINTSYENVPIGQP